MPVKQVYVVYRDEAELELIMSNAGITASKEEAAQRDREIEAEMALFEVIKGALKISDEDAETIAIALVNNHDAMRIAAKAVPKAPRPAKVTTAP